MGVAQMVMVVVLGGTYENDQVQDACGKFCACNWDPQLPNIPPPQVPGILATCTNILHSNQLACVQCAYGAPVSMYTDRYSFNYVDSAPAAN